MLLLERNQTDRPHDFLSVRTTKMPHQLAIEYRACHPRLQSWRGAWSRYSHGLQQTGYQPAFERTGGLPLLSQKPSSLTGSPANFVGSGYLEVSIYAGIHAERDNPDGRSELDSHEPRQAYVVSVHLHSHASHADALAVWSLLPGPIIK